MHDEQDHFAVCCETIFLKISSTTGAVVVSVTFGSLIDDVCAFAVVTAGEPKANNALDVVVPAAADDVVDIVDDDDDDEEDDVDVIVESIFGAAPPKANVPNGSIGFVSVEVLPNENVGVAAAALVLSVL